jgi:hypothetical protein
MKVVIWVGSLMRRIEMGAQVDILQYQLFVFQQRKNIYRSELLKEYTLNVKKPLMKSLNGLRWI